ncbi:MAG: hypothetical protein WCC60_06905 [Ilumatobacteraceae bacterium]
MPNRLSAPGQVRVHISPKVLSDLDAFQTVQRSILDRLGCGGCTSGFDINWLLHPDFVVNPAGEIRQMTELG